MKEKTLFGNLRRLVAVGSLASLVVAAGCCSGKRCFKACASNVKNGYPVITCQPEDQGVKEGEPAVFSVEAEGQSLYYQWFRILPGNPEPEPINNANSSEFKIPAVAHGRDDGLYFCAVTDPAGNVTHTRQAGLGGRGPGAGSGFVPVQFTSSSGAMTTVCNPPNNCTAKWVRFPGTQLMPTTATSFTGNILITNVAQSRWDIFPRSKYYLQWFYSSANGENDCFDPVANSQTEQVGATLVSGREYRFTLFFTPGNAPANGTVFKLQGDWQ